MQPLASAGGEWNGEAVLAPGAIDDRTPQGFRAKDVLAAIDAGKFEIVHNVNLSPKTCHFINPSRIWRCRSALRPVRRQKFPRHSHTHADHLHLVGLVAAERFPLIV